MWVTLPPQKLQVRFRRENRRLPLRGLLPLCEPLFPSAKVYLPCIIFHLHTEQSGLVFPGFYLLRLSALIGLCRVLPQEDDLLGDKLCSKVLFSAGIFPAPGLQTALHVNL